MTTALTQEQRKAKMRDAAKHATEVIGLITSVFGSLDVDSSECIAAGAARAEAIRLRLMVDGLANYLAARGAA